MRYIKCQGESRGRCRYFAFLFLTHAHIDHIGRAPTLISTTGAAIFALASAVR
ncbi:MAG: MBL fold metallo-hydrolase [Deltaproteobacteria bacterium]|nr:MBL fold metallo-hydrolase [Candidatus Anaeroferrophillacea bacterium]